MSLNIDMNRILPVKFSGVSPNLYSKLLASVETEMADIEQAQQMIPLNTCEISFG